MLERENAELTYDRYAVRPSIEKEGKKCLDTCSDNTTNAKLIQKASICSPNYLQFYMTLTLITARLNFYLGKAN